ncbi:MAG: DmsE family decaheme c-type cytochrome [Wenzhouxiangellaceae bacterium]|nr:DmsE family decaheme c-type cytochrome [Wenzhouxiangellaceae bacterium]
MQRGLVPVFIVLLLVAGAIAAQEGDDYMPEYSRTGADTCLRCHGADEEDAWLLDVLHGPHGVAADSRTPFGSTQCEACHGPGGDHTGRIRPGQERPAMPAFASNSPWSQERQDQQCRNCHDGPDHRFWDGDTHQRNDVGCVDCHQSHVRRDPVTVTATESQVCYACHAEQRSQFQRASAHPVRFGEMSCSSCHQPHGSANAAMLTQTTLNENCYECHAEYRGPVLWEHAPVVEDCSNCHQPHGSNHPSMLTRRAPLLCQSCHSRLGHPSVGLTGDDLDSGPQSAFLLSGSCTSCHSQVHGSNHPSGAILNR